MSHTFPVGYLVFFIVAYILWNIGLYKLFEKAGEKGWKALVPIYRWWIMIHLVGKGTKWFIMTLIPVINAVMYLVIQTEMVKAYGKDGFWAGVAAMMVPYFYFPWMGFDKKVKYVGHPEEVYKNRKKSFWREWADAIAFAVVAATFIRTFFFEPFTIPTTSLEGTLKAGDFLFVSKFHYGARVPITPLAFPFAQHTMPLIGTKAFSTIIQLPYMRFPGLQDVHRYDIVVFNFPEGDTVVLSDQASSYYDIIRGKAEELKEFDMRNKNGVKPMNYYLNTARNGYINSGDISVRPIDKTDNYVKRCVGLPGDSIEIRNEVLYVNGEQGYKAPHQQMMYFVYSKGVLDRQTFWKDNIGINTTLSDYAEKISADTSIYRINADDAQIEKLKQIKSLRVVPVDWNITSYALFPDDSQKLGYTVENYGPIWIPKKGVTIKINSQNYLTYKRIIEVYEKNAITRDANGAILMDGKPLTEYTFKQNYYWMLGDNRENSADSRYWGFVPEDHIVGKPVLVWFSWDREYPFLQRFAHIRWSRMMHLI